MKLFSSLFSILFLSIILFVSSCSLFHLREMKSFFPDRSNLWIPDKGNGTYKNPVIYADYSDPDVIRVGDDFYMTSSSFNCVPGLPILHSRDLINWKIIGHALQSLKPGKIFDTPQHGKGVWAPSIRYHKNKFYIYYGDPDFGIYLVTATNPAGPWDEPLLIKKAKGWIDPCPLWDDDGNVYLVHAWAKSRSGYNSILTLNRMNSDGTKILDSGITIFDGHKNHPTIEGPKLYKRNGYYYIFTPAGGVKAGWQTVLRAKNIYGPYEDKIVMDQGDTEVNGPHQGAWVELESGESWFIHFQDKDAYGRVVHLQPVNWLNDWPVIGIDKNGDGKGEPVQEYVKPNVGRFYSIDIPQTSDEFNLYTLGLQWQWHANPKPNWYSLVESHGRLRLNCINLPDNFRNFWDVPNLLLQKFPAPEFEVITKIKCDFNQDGEKAGLIVMGIDYSYISIQQQNNKLTLSHLFCLNADKGSTEVESDRVSISSKEIYLRVKIGEDAKCNFSYSEDGNKYILVGDSFTAKPGKWIGAKIGLFSISKSQTAQNGYADFDWFRY
ncbi:MAG: glycoside hydrolase 43 family protein [Ignavibacteriales bacterium]|nr:glycoside hydrolase 43 family protein [Ignavibacteriales bacterium]